MSKSARHYGTGAMMTLKPCRLNSKFVTKRATARLSAGWKCWVPRWLDADDHCAVSDGAIPRGGDAEDCHATRWRAGRPSQEQQGRAATVFFVPLSTPLNLLSECHRARYGQGQAASRWPSAILDLRCARRLGRGQVGTKERSGFDRTKERGLSSLVVGRVPSRACH